MESDDDTFLLPPDGPVSEGESETHVLPPEIEPALGDAVDVRRGRPRPPKRCGSLGVWLYKGEPGYEPASSSSGGPTPVAPPERVRVVGVGVVRWEFVELTGSGVVARAVADIERRHEPDPPWGRITYAL